MVYVLEKLFHNADLDVDLASFIDSKQNIWFMAKDIAQTLGYSNTNDAIIKHVSEKYQKPTLAFREVRSDTKFLHPNKDFMN